MLIDWLLLFFVVCCVIAFMLFFYYDKPSAWVLRGTEEQTGHVLVNPVTQTTKKQDTEFHPKSRLSTHCSVWKQAIILSILINHTSALIVM